MVVNGFCQKTRVRAEQVINNNIQRGRISKLGIYSSSVLKTKKGGTVCKI